MPIKLEYYFSIEISDYSSAALTTWTVVFLSVVAVILSADAGSRFRGFLIQARKPGDDTMSYGTFDVAESSLSQTLDCFEKNKVS